MIPNGSELNQVREFAVAQRIAALATVSPSGDPEAALMGVAVTPDFEIVFDTLNTTRKYTNLAANLRVALVVGCSGGVSIQYEGVAEVLDAQRDETYLELYFGAFPNGRSRQQWVGMTYFLIRPRWLRYCDYTQHPPRVREFQF